MRDAAGAALLCALTAVSLFAQAPPLVDQIREKLTSGALKTDVSFLASDLLQGRATPSPGLDLAAEYIAGQFRGAGLEPPGDSDYFQTAHYSLVSPRLDGFDVTVEIGGNGIRLDRSSVVIGQPVAAVLNHAAAVKLDSANAAALSGQLAGKAVFIEVPNLPSLPAGERQKAADDYIRLRMLARSRKPALLIALDARPLPRAAPPRFRDTTPAIPEIQVNHPELRKVVAAAPAGLLSMTVSARIPEPAASPASVHNVIGVLRGSDPALRDTYLVVSAHYDHLGVQGKGPGAQIFNGANDDASGTATVIEIAKAFAALKERPRRSIVFLAFFGEERGLLGSQYYVQHPAVPLAQTVADINLEQTGRTDDESGAHLLQFNSTGFDYTTLAETFRMAGEATNVRLVKDQTRTNPFFSQSDNFSFADVGIPSTTLSVTYEFPDAHLPGDKWPKLDYENMASVDLAIAWGVWMIAEDPQTPQWNLDNPAAAQFARRNRRPN